MGGKKIRTGFLRRNPVERPHRSPRSKFGVGGVWGNIKLDFEDGVFLDWIGFIRIR
jgi:hypothetical protein